MMRFGGEVGSTGFKVKLARLQLVLNSGLWGCMVVKRF